MICNQYYNNCKILISYSISYILIGLSIFIVLKIKEYDKINISKQLIIIIIIILILSAFINFMYIYSKNLNIYVNNVHNIPITNNTDIDIENINIENIDIDNIDIDNIDNIEDLRSMFNIDINTMSNEELLSFIDELITNNSNNIIKNEIDQLILKKKTINNNNNIDCAICLSNIQNLYIDLECKHMFHENCLKTWLEHNTNCPLCRRELFNL